VWAKDGGGVRVWGEGVGRFLEKGKKCAFF